VRGEKKKRGEKIFSVPFLFVPWVLILLSIGGSIELSEKKGEGKGRPMTPNLVTPEKLGSCCLCSGQAGKRGGREKKNPSSLMFLSIFDPA